MLGVLANVEEQPHWSNSTEVPDKSRFLIQQQYKKQHI